MGIIKLDALLALRDSLKRKDASGREKYTRQDYDAEPDSLREPFVDELRMNLLSKNNAEEREFVIRAYLDEMRTILDWIDLDQIVRHELLKDNEANIEELFPYAYEKFCTYRIDSYPVIMRDILTTCITFKIKFWKMIVALNYPTRYIDQFMDKVNDAEFDLTYLDSVARHNPKLKLEAIAVLVKYLKQEITTDNCNAIARRFGHTSGKKLLDFYKKWDLPLPMRKGYETENLFRNRLKVMDLVLEIFPVKLVDGIREYDGQYHAELIVANEDLYNELKDERKVLFSKFEKRHP